MSALFAALVCVATMLIRIPLPITGYANLGDGVVLLCAWALGPVYGTAAAGLGSALADILSGYTAYAPASLVIKALSALTACIIITALRGRDGKVGYPRLALAGICGEAVMVCGYFAYEFAVFGKAEIAAMGALGNSIQGICGIVVFLLLAAVLYNNKITSSHVWARESR